MTPTPTTASALETILAGTATAYATWAQATRADRASALNAVADRLDAAADELVALAQVETHLPEGRLRGELKRTTFQLRIFG